MLAGIEVGAGAVAKVTHNVIQGNRARLVLSPELTPHAWDEEAFAEEIDRRHGHH